MYNARIVVGMHLYSIPVTGQHRHKTRADNCAESDMHLYSFGAQLNWKI